MESHYSNMNQINIIYVYVFFRFKLWHVNDTNKCSSFFSGSEFQLPKIYYRPRLNANKIRLIENIKKKSKSRLLTRADYKCGLLVGGA